MQALREGIRAGLEAAGFSEHYESIWGILAYSEAEILDSLHTKAQAIRERWAYSSERERRFANWVALRTSAAAETELAFRGWR